MSDKIEKTDLKKIETLEEVQIQKQKIKAEMDVLSTNISNSAREMLRQGAKVAAAGVAAAIISKAIGTLITNRKEAKQSSSTPPPTDETTFASAAPNLHSDARQHSDDEGATVQSIIRSAIVWLDIITKGIETVKILMNEFRPDQDANSEDVPADTDADPQAEDPKEGT